MKPGEALRPGRSLGSEHGQYRLTMQADGNLVLYVARSDRPVWHTHTHGHPGAWAVMQTDGNLVVYDTSGTALWHSGTGGHPGAYFAVQRDSNLVVYDSASRPLWASGLRNDQLRANEVLVAEQYLKALNGKYHLYMQADGNLVLYKEGGPALWSTGTHGHPGAWAIMQGDGNLVVYGSGGSPLWNAQTAGHPGANLVVQGDSNLVIYHGGPAIWNIGIRDGGGGGGHAPVDDYPSNLKSAPMDSLFDPWRFYNRECTSFVAWRMNSRNGVAFSNYMRGGHWGNANHWHANAVALGYPVNTTPAVGAIAVWDAGSGHVAWVAAVNPDGSALIEQYNQHLTGTYSYEVRRAPLYIHVKDL
jgi:surface antigen